MTWELVSLEDVGKGGIMVCGVRVDQTSIASTMKLAHVGPRFGYIGQMCSPFEPQTLFQKPMEGPKVEPKEQLSEQG